MDSNSKVFVAGHNGLVGSAIIRNLKAKHYENIYWIRKKNCDLTNKTQVDAYFEQAKPEYVFLAAAKVGGIGGNSTYPAEFIYENLMIQTNVIDAAYRHGVKKLLFLGSSCIYPKMADQPISEDALMSGPLEPTNDAYATAKIAGIKMCQAYRQQYGFNAISLMPTNLYGPNDSFDINTGHVLPSLIGKFHGSLEKSKHWVVKLWGDGSPKREFLHVDDLAEACIKCMQDYDEPEPINVGTGEDVTIKELAETIVDVVGYKNYYEWDTDKPNGTPRKVLNVDKMKSLGWEPKIGLREGIESTYAWYKENANV
tara:strand:- start:8622 stop:9557 length:936 start_codon:yes stop_codon:yes gene_type:complete